jgi:hypothetical protein
MTSLVAILNKEAIALGADSAGTIHRESGDKIFTVNKIFMLSKHAPVGIMIYGAANLVGVPWEIIIKIYRDYISNDKFDTLEDYAKNFINFLKNDTKKLFNGDAQDFYFKSTSYSYLYLISKSLKNILEKEYKEKEELTDEDIEKRILKFLNDLYEKFYKESIHADSEKFRINLLVKYRTVIQNFKREIFGYDILKHKKISIKLTELVIEYFLKFPNGLSEGSGIVIAGFGENEIFPSIKSFLVDGMINNQLIYRKYKERKIDFKTIASITPFAQDEMVHMFMTGVDPKYQSAIEDDLSILFKDYSNVVDDLKSLKELSEDKKISIKKELDKVNLEIREKYINGLKTYRDNKYIDPTMEIVSSLPKGELALMAETFMYLTSFKRKMSPESETVAEPIDVAIISKGDGFVWIKRKHYFEPKLNHQFFKTYFDNP